MIHASWSKHRLDFRFTAVTSRDRLTHKDTYFVRVTDDSRPGVSGIGEAALFRGLSVDDVPDYETTLDKACRDISRLSRSGLEELAHYPSIRFGIETALLDFARGGMMDLFDNAWSRGEDSMRINGLVWMGDKATMLRRIDEKLASGFSCIKIKIGGIDFESELELLRHVRGIAPGVEIRLDANGAFAPYEAPEKLDALARFDIHSIEQPVRAGQWSEMSRICRESPIPVALDEELIGLHDIESRERMLDTIRPAYIILKPSLTGGFASSDRWISSASERGIGWWATSALESDIGLNAIAQWTASHSPLMPQGLGTGQLYSNNIPSPIRVRSERIFYDTSLKWILPD